MAISVGKKFYWLPRPSAWESTQQWRAKRAEMTAKFEELNQTAVNGFASAQYNDLNGSVANAQQAAIDRLKKSA